MRQHFRLSQQTTHIPRKWFSASCCAITYAWSQDVPIIPAGYFDASSALTMQYARDMHSGMRRSIVSPAPVVPAVEAVNGGGSTETVLSTGLGARDSDQIN